MSEHNNPPKELKREWLYFNVMVNRWVKEHRDQFVVIKGTTRHGPFFDLEQQAKDYGRMNLGAIPFLVARVTTEALHFYYSALREDWAFGIKSEPS